MTVCIARSSAEIVLVCLYAGLRKHVLHELAPLQLSESCKPPMAGGDSFANCCLKHIEKAEFSP